ncbi:hypothetical protein EOPP23_12220 [Endozoicomonas sp. OPT23]|uniref:type IVB secretion system protein IcmH/DotU n=1 Tax=Endozoicomonas sp. OPT23 TaxID=2072845 RepID=UPI00129B6AA3|nr:type IVB secretion system protein IcmH/DotU [Endozoicomonas sp. OPT23]MRI33753.1 hypothetical protein [Endozoicomonas sp. OPT23]
MVLEESGNTVNDITCHDVTTQLQSFSGSENMLINLAAEVLAILTTMDMAESTPNAPELYSYLKKRITEFHGRGLKADYSTRVMEKACYLLCAALDEEAMRSWWGQNLCWENHSLVAGMFQQRNAGEVFFLLINQARQNTAGMIDFLELAYLLLRMGFHGQYLNGSSRPLVDLTDQLYQEIIEHRQRRNTNNLSTATHQWQPLSQLKLHRWVSGLVVTLLVLAVGCHFWISHTNTLSVDVLEKVLNSANQNIRTTSD